MDKEVFDEMDDIFKELNEIFDEIPKDNVEMMSEYEDSLYELVDKLAKVISLDAVIYFIAKYMIYADEHNVAARSYDSNTGSDLLIFRMSIHSKYYEFNDDLGNYFDEKSFGPKITSDVLDEIAHRCADADVVVTDVVVNYMAYHNKSEINFNIPNFTLEAEFGYYLDDLD